MKAIDEMVKSFSVIPLDEKFGALDLLEKSSSMVATHKSIFEIAMNCVEECLAADNYELAGKLLKIAESAVAKTDSTAQRTMLAGRVAEVETIRKEYHKIKTDQATLQTNPDDADANLEVGKFQCFYKGDWIQGLPHLMKGSDKKLKELAKMDLEASIKPVTQLELADAWWNPAAGSDKSIQTGLQLRAHFWYTAAYADLKGLTKARVDKRIAEIDKIVNVRGGRRPKASGENLPLQITLELGQGVKMPMVLIDPKAQKDNGKFKMGSSKEEQGYLTKTQFDGKRPDFLEDENQIEVELTKPYYLAKTELSQAQYQALGFTISSKFQVPKLPVENVSWDDAQLWLKSADEKVKLPAGLKDKGYQLHLPTEAQWEYACRAGTHTAFYFGDKLNGDKANCKGTIPYGMGKGNYLEKTTPVGSAKYKPNSFGLYDMHGNVWAWCEDYFGKYSDLKSPKDPIQTVRQQEERHVLRGGSWGDRPELSLGLPYQVLAK